jgi:RNA polymerase sigma-70 factor (ECF subfamily)
VIGRVHERLEQEAARRGTTERLARLRPFLSGSEPGGTYAALAREWGVGEPAVRVALHRLRRRFGELLRQEIGRTVDSAAEIDDEIRYLLGVLGS